MDDNSGKIKELKIRLSLANYCIQTLEAMKTPEAYDVLERIYIPQRDRIQKRLDEFTKPPDVVVGLKTAVLFPKVQN